jgi:hypothetical protein
VARPGRPRLHRHTAALRPAGWPGPEASSAMVVGPGPGPGPPAAAGAPTSAGRR